MNKYHCWLKRYCSERGRRSIYDIISFAFLCFFQKITGGVVRSLFLCFWTRNIFTWSFTSDFPKTTPLTQSSCFSSSVWPPAAHRVRGSGRLPVWAGSSEVRWCSRCGKGRPAYTSQSRWKEGQSRARSVRGGGERLVRLSVITFHSNTSVWF